MLREHLVRLVPVAQRALAEAEERRRRQAAEEQLRETEERFRQFTGHSADAFCFFTSAPERAFCRPLYLSPAFERVLGVPPEALHDRPDAWGRGATRPVS